MTREALPPVQSTAAAPKRLLAHAAGRARPACITFAQHCAISIAGPAQEGRRNPPSGQSGCRKFSLYLHNAWRTATDCLPKQGNSPLQSAQPNPLPELFRAEPCRTIECMKAIFSRPATRPLTCARPFVLAFSLAWSLSLPAHANPAAPTAAASVPAQTPDLMERVGQLGDEAQAFLDAQDYTHAALRSQQAIALVEQQRGPNDPLIEDPLTLLTTIYAAQNKPTDLEAAYLRLIPLFIELHGEDNPATQGRIIDLVNFYREQQSFAAAVPWIQRLIAIKTRTDGADAPGIELMHQALAQCYFMQAQYADAAREYQTEISLIGKAGTDHTKYTGIPMLALAEVYAAQGQHSRAIATARQALGILESGFGKDSKLACDARQRLARVTTAPGKAGEIAPQTTACRHTPDDSESAPATAAE
jgi:tetratricopeptide (TPR) repeat protein